jgi:UDP-N-acetylglucosamine--N-acetylmuramyl-(pentapeptide) pyrophosphoryl-undecaprenol N-acetylglucosamine transferase
VSTKINKNTKQNHFILSGGGTGGHIYPALAIAEALEAYPNTSVSFVGALGKMEMEKIPQAGYKILGLPIRGLQRGKIWANLSLPFRIITSLTKSYFHLKKVQPKAVIGTGGYASAPIALVASWLKIPVYLQEQNSFPGLVNRKMAKYAQKVFVAYPNMDRFFPENKIIYSGNPIRKNILEKLQVKTENQTSTPKLLILGGSLGARSINDFFIQHIETLAKESIEIQWQCGKLYEKQCKDAWEKAGRPENIHIQAFIQNMAEAYAQAHLVLCRAGALTVSEIALMQKPAIFVPSPNVTDNHQYKNALALAEKNAALLWEEKQLKEEHSLQYLLTTLEDQELQGKLKSEIVQFSKSKASEEIAKQILQK